MLGTPSNTGSLRRGAGSPSNYETGGKLFSKRAREIQAEEGVGPSLWGPLSSGNPIQHETIQEETTSPTYGETPAKTITPPGLTPPIGRRARAGTMPSRLPPGGFLPPPGPPLPVTSRPSPSVSPFKATSLTNGDSEPKLAPTAAAPSTSSVASRLRSGSLNLPPRANYVSPFGPSIFNTPWASTTRERNVSTSSTNGPTSPAQSSFSKEDDHSGPMRTLDYLGLADPPITRVSNVSQRVYDPVSESQRAAAMQPLLGNMDTLHRNLTRLRSYSVNAKEKYEEDEEEEINRQTYDSRSGNVTPGGAAAVAIAQAQAQAQAAAVLNYANTFTVSRPRARTAGVLDSPAPRTMKSYMTTPSRLGDSVSASDMNIERDYFGVGLEGGQLLPRPSSGGEVGLLNTVDEGLEGPTRALWLGNIPASTTTSSLVAIFQTYGPIESARVLTHKNCGFVNFEQLESAVNSRNMLNGKEIFPGAGPVRIGYAKVPTTPNSGTPAPIGMSPSPDPNAMADGASANDTRGGTPAEMTESMANLDPTLTLPKLSDLRPDIVKIVQEFGATEQEAARIGQSVDFAVSYTTFADEIPSIPEPSHNRLHDAPKLRDIRKRIDNNTCSQAEIEEIAEGMLDEIAELASDYLGNTVVQKLFEFCSEEVKFKMLERISPHLAEIGVHKNGTWAGQKIIDVARTDQQKQLICDSLRPYTVALFLDQYGNYVLQCCLRFGAPWNNFIFESMLGKMWDISQGRFGARAMRACLESHYANKDQQRMMAAAIALHSVQLATNANGALLLTWLLDTCTFPRRRTVLAPRLVPHLVHLCTHKVAYLTVLKVINQRNEPEAREAILRAMFYSPQDRTLELILSDHSCGATLIFKVLTTPFFDEELRGEVVQNVKNVLLKIKAHPAHGYKRLMDEVGLPTRSGGSKEHSRERRGHNTASPSRGERNRSRDHHHSNRDHHHGRNQAHDTPPREFNQPVNHIPAGFGGYDQGVYPNVNGQVPRNGVMDPTMVQAMEQLNMYGQPQMVAPQQYSAAMMANRGGRGAPAQPNYYPQVTANMTGYVGQMGQIQTLGSPGGLMNSNPMAAQNGMTASPILPVGIPQGFNPMVAQNMIGAYGGYPPGMNGVGNVPVYPPQGPPQNQGGNRRR